jgi:hypothetical protein
VGVRNRDARLRSDPPEKREYPHRLGRREQRRRSAPAKEVVWSIEKKVPGTDIDLAWTTCLQELPNGNLLIGNCRAGEDNPRIFEITKDKMVVWDFDECDLVGNGLACGQVIEGEESAMLHKKLAALGTTAK